MEKLLNCFDFNEKLSLYVHVPFCTSKCSYCAFFSKPSCSEDVKNEYLYRIVDEIRSLSSKMKGPFYTAFIGGGNPGCLDANQLEMIAKAVCENGRPEEFSTEMNPESLSEEHFSLFEKYFTRLSMGVQSLSPEALEFLGRNSSMEQTLRGMEISQNLRRDTGCILSYDLITCLPAWHDSKKDLTELVENYRPDHLSLYALTLEEGTPLFIRKPKLPDSDEQEFILSELWKLLREYGYNQYEVSNFALNGNVCKHNCVYWDYRQYVGLGPGAASTGFKDGNAFRAEASHSLSNWDYDVCPLTKEESYEEFVFMGMRHTQGLDLNRLKNEFSHDLAVIPEGFSVENGFLVPDSYGLMTADYAASVLLY